MLSTSNENYWSSVIPKHMQEAINKSIKRQFHKLPLLLVEKWLEPKFLDKEWFREARKYIDFPYSHLFDEAPSD